MIYFLIIIAQSREFLCVATCVFRPTCDKKKKKLYVLR